MSSRVIARILPIIRDLVLFEESLENLSIKYSKVENIITVENYDIRFTIRDNQITAEFDSYNRQANKIIDGVINKYHELYKIKVEELRRQLEASQREMELAEEHEKNEKQLKTNQINRELQKIEKIKSIEKKLLQEKIKQAEDQILERAKSNGFTIQKTQSGQKQVIRLVRRQ
jgi:hypothetical protein